MTETAPLKQWTLEEAAALCAQLAPPLRRAGWVPGLTGSVLTHGFSKKDLDLVMYPMDCSNPPAMERFREILTVHGLRHVRSAEWVKIMWKRKGSTDTKHVETWAQDGRRIDVFVFGGPP